VGGAVASLFHFFFMATKTHPSSQIFNKCRELIKLLNVHLNHFPRHEKFALCQEIRNAVYDVYQLLVEHQKKYYNKTTLTKLDIRHEQLRMLVNLSFEMGYYEYKDNKRGHSEAEAQRRYTAASVLINELGAMIGSRIRNARDNPRAANGVTA